MGIVRYLLLKNVKSQFWNIEAGNPLGLTSQSHGIWFISIEIYPNSRLIASGLSNKTLQLWDAITGQKLGKPLRGHEDWITRMKFSSGSRRMVFISSNIVRLWNTETGQALAVYILQTFEEILLRSGLNL
jgi:WD40 repeat protein